MKRSRYKPQALLPMTTAAVLVAALTIAITASAAETWLQTVLRITGISAAPSPRSAGLVETGNVWVATVDGSTTTRWTVAGGFGSPVFDVGGVALYAMQQDDLVRIAAPNAKPEVVRKVVGVDKLIGFDPRVPTNLIILMRGEIAPLAVLSTSGVALVPQPVDLSALDQQRVLANLRGQNRSSGSLRIIVDKVDKESLAGVIEWTDVFAADGSGARRNLSRCDGVSCFQPALSPDLTRVAYIRSGN